MSEEHQIGTIISKLEGELSFQLKMQCIMTYYQLIPNDLNIERDLIAQKHMPTCRDNRSSTSYNNKPRMWAKNKNITNDGVIDAKVVISAPQQKTHQKTYPQHNTHQPQINYQQNTPQTNTRQQ